jgi:hypothetical protein
MESLTSLGQHCGRQAARNFIWCIFGTVSHLLEDGVPGTKRFVPRHPGCLLGSLVQ